MKSWKEGETLREVSVLIGSIYKISKAIFEEKVYVDLDFVSTVFLVTKST